MSTVDKAQTVVFIILSVAILIIAIALVIDVVDRVVR